MMDGGKGTLDRTYRPSFFRTVRTSEAIQHHIKEITASEPKFPPRCCPMSRVGLPLQKGTGSVETRRVNIRVSRLCALGGVAVQNNQPPERQKERLGKIQPRSPMSRASHCSDCLVAKEGQPNARQTCDRVQYAMVGVCTV